eukprot:1722135-Rhodomonas_salina.3
MQKLCTTCWHATAKPQHGARRGAGYPAKKGAAHYAKRRNRAKRRRIEREQAHFSTVGERA